MIYIYIYIYIDNQVYQLRGKYPNRDYPAIFKDERELPLVGVTGFLRVAQVAMTAGRKKHELRR